MAVTAKAQDGKVITDGQETTLTLIYDGGDHPKRERYAYVEAKGTLRAFKEGGKTRWEISTDDPQHPAIGFLPENVKTLG